MPAYIISATASGMLVRYFSVLRVGRMGGERGALTLPNVFAASLGWHSGDDVEWAT